MVISDDVAIVRRERPHVVSGGVVVVTGNAVNHFSSRNQQECNNEASRTASAPGFSVEESGG